MRDRAAIEEPFTDLGADFLLSAAEIGDRLETVRAFVLDWDGVFNVGGKGEDAPSTFTEPDSMGTNLLRYAFWRQRGNLPVCAIVSGADNPTAKFFGQRERFDAVFCGFTDKGRAFDVLCEKFALQRTQIAWVFDDVNDLSAARDCALRFMIRRDSSPLMREFVATNGLADYITAAPANAYPVREIAELLIGLLKGFPDVFESRLRFDDRYRTYFAARQRIDTVVIDGA